MQIARSPRTDRVRCVHRVRRDCVAARRRCRHVVIWHHRRPGLPPPTGCRHRFRWGRGGVIIVVVIRVCAPHIVKETPGVIVVRMGEDDRPSPTTTHYSFPSGDVVPPIPQVSPPRSHAWRVLSAPCAKMLVGNNGWPTWLEMSPTCRAMSATTLRVAPILARWVRVADTKLKMSWQFVSA